MNQTTVELIINGKQIVSEIETDLRLVKFLRENVGLTGTKEICSEGECGACSIILNGKIVNSCLIFTVEVNNCDITTIEGIAKNDKLTKIQEKEQCKCHTDITEKFYE